MTDQQERNAVIESFAAAIRSREVEVPCPHSLGEYKMFFVNPKGKAEAAAGAHDDDVLSDAIAWDTMPSATEYKRHMAKHVDPHDRGKQGWRSASGRW